MSTSIPIETIIVWGNMRKPFDNIDRGGAYTCESKPKEGNRYCSKVEDVLITIAQSKVYSPVS